MYRTIATDSRCGSKARARRDDLRSHSFGQLRGLCHGGCRNDHWRVFDIGACATWIMQLVQRKARAQRHGKDKMVQKLEKGILHRDGVTAKE